ncbi:MAG: prolyl oligopeptidase family serine peptidase [Acidimicrobiia bacterium]|nr:prolyl oligopeptidase family serine peptidase [Acidimicrobiia bacterium]
MPEPTTTTTAPPTVSVGDDRPARLVLPPQWSGTGAQLPLVVVLHGYGTTGRIQDIYLGISARGGEFGFMTLIPDGTTDQFGNQFWNVTDAATTVDDTAYLSETIDEAISDYNGDPDAVYLVGHSNGGFMANRLACRRPDLIAGIAAIAGGLFGGGNECTAGPTVLMIQGTSDATVPYDGGTFLGDRILGAEATAEQWVGVNGCTGADEIEGPFDYDLLVRGDETTVRAWDDCAAGPVELWTMEGSGHIPAFRPGFRTALLDRLLG